MLAEMTSKQFSSEIPPVKIKRSYINNKITIFHKNVIHLYPQKKAKRRFEIIYENKILIFWNSCEISWFNFKCSYWDITLSKLLRHFWEILEMLFISCSWLNRWECAIDIYGHLLGNRIIQNKIESYFAKIHYTRKIFRFLCFIKFCWI